VVGVARQDVLDVMEKYIQSKLCAGAPANPAQRTNERNDKNKLKGGG